LVNESDNRGSEVNYPTEKLFQDLSSIDAYPTGMERVPSQIPGLGFFPGGRGVYQETGSRDPPPFPFHEVMIVGQDFDTVQNYQASRCRGEEKRQSATWRNLLKLLDDSNIPKTACFFTNAYMGLRSSGKNTGPCLGSRSEAFRDTCRSFFMRQLAVQEPRAILCLGTQVTRFLAGCSADLRAWTAGSFRSIDSSCASVVFDVHFADARSVLAVVALVHPSFRAANLGRREYGDCQGACAERRMLRDAMAHIGGIGGSATLNE
jgi:uracil-DNA glycosylase